MPAGRIKDHWGEQRLFETRSLIAGVLMVLLTLTLAGRLVLLQVIRNDYYADLSQGNRVRTEPIPAARGVILDRNGAVLVDNEPAYQLELTREQVPDLKDTLNRLAALGLIEKDDVEETRHMIMARRSFDTVPVRLRLTDEETGRFAVHRFEFPGVDLATRQTRHYPYGELGVHALGYVGAISEADLEHIDRVAYEGTALMGKLGVEASYEKALHGTNGHREILVNAQGRSVQRQGAYAPDLHATPPESGEDLILSIDLPTQQAAENALGDHRGAVVAIDPSNGNVLALVSKPGFDPSVFARGIRRNEYAELVNNDDKPLLNRALRGTYPSGSTIKPAIALVALTDKFITAETRVGCYGSFSLPGSAHVWRADKTEPKGELDLTAAIAHSSDVFFYRLAWRMGIDKLAEGLAPFGYGQLTGIDIAGERPGILPSQAWKRTAFKRPVDQVWFPGETVNLGVGQGYLLVTPLQLAHVAAVLSERGRSFRPRLVTGLHDADGHVKSLPPVEEPPVTGIAAADWDTVLNAMVGVNRYGTGALAFAKTPYTSAGKTGTAQVYSVAQNAKYNEKTVSDKLRDHAWFIAYAPAEAPRIALAVLVENAGWGGSNAAPVARKVIDAYLLDKEGKVKPFATPAQPNTPNTSPLPAPKPPATTPPAQTQTTVRSDVPTVSPAS
jgi:penicillin-binding protein 2